MDAFVELITEQQWRQGWEVLRGLRKELRLEDFLERRERLLGDGFRLYALMSKERILAVVSAVIVPHVTRGHDLWIHDLAAAGKSQGYGYGVRLIRKLEQFAAAQGFNRVLVYTLLDHAAAQKFYQASAGFDPYAVVLMREVG